MNMIVKSMCMLVLSVAASALPVDNYLKPGAAVRMVFPEQHALDLNETAELEFVFRSSAKNGVATVNISADKGLEHDALDEVTFQVEEGEFRLPVTVSSALDGRRYLHFSVELNGMRRSFSYGQNIGYVETKVDTKPVQGGANIKVLRATETINNE